MLGDLDKVAKLLADFGLPRQIAMASLICLPQLLSNVNDKRKTESVL